MFRPPYAESNPSYHEPDRNGCINPFTMKAYRYELIAVVFVLLGSILFSVFGIAEGPNTLADEQAPSKPDSAVVSLK